MQSRVEKLIEDCVAFLCYKTGLLSFVQKYISQKGLVPILMYHSIIDSKSSSRASCLDLCGMTVTKKTFDAQMKFLKDKNYSIISIEHFLEISKTGQPLPENSIVITFDDGFKDNYTLAFPVLKKYNICATIFLIGQCLKDQSLVWRHEFYQLLDDCPKESFHLKDFYGISEKYTLDPKGKKDILNGRLKRLLSKSPPQKQKEILSRLKEIVDFETKESRSYYLSFEDMNEMLKHHIKAGAHTMTHSNMRNLTFDESLHEVLESKRIVEGISQSDQTPFAYPFGQKSHVNGEALRAVRKSGVTCGLSTVEGLNSVSEDRFFLKRIEINDIPMHTFFFRITGMRGFIKSRLKKILGKN